MEIFNIVTGCVIEMYLLHFFLFNYFEKREVFKRSVWAMIVLQIVAISMETLCNSLHNVILNLIFVPVILASYAMIMFRGKIGHRLFCFFMYIIILDCCEFIFIIIWQPDADSVDMGNVKFLLQTLLIKFISYIIILLVNHLVGKQKRIMDSKVLVMYMFIPVSSFSVLVATYCSIMEIDLTWQQSLVLVSSFCFLFLGNIVSFYAFENYSERIFQNMQQNVIIVKQKKDMEFYMQATEQEGRQKKLMHDINNYIKMITHFAKTEDYNSVRRLCSEISGEMEESMQHIYCNNPILNSMLNEKRVEADRYGITTEFYVEPGVVLGAISMTDMIAMFGNLLDNAIRAASEAREEKYIKLHIYMKEVGGFCVTKIVNSFERVIQENNGKFLSTKTEDGVHGIGIQNVNQIAEKYGGYLTCMTHQKEFEALLLISTDDE